MYPRILDISRTLRRKSLFLFGARQVGKTTYLKDKYPNALRYDLLSSAVFRELSANPELLYQRTKSDDQLVLIDEIQLLPSLLNEVQRLITEFPDLRFVMTGSSARKLKLKGANLLGGRASEHWLGPLVSPELSYARLNLRLNIGSLPQVIDSADPQADLKDYTALYLQQEIQFEGLVRNIESFSRFLPTAALCTGTQVNFTQTANDCQISPHTLREYFQILVDTFVGFLLPAYTKTVKRKAVTSAKFYLFDVGVTNSLLRRGIIEPGTELYGNALEQLIIIELRSYLSYHALDHQLTYWRSTSKLEVDALIDDSVAIEVKAKSLVSNKDANGLLALAEEIPLKRKIIVANEREKRTILKSIEVIPIEQFLKDLWSGEII